MAVISQPLSWCRTWAPKTFGLQLSPQPHDLGLDLFPGLMTRPGPGPGRQRFPPAPFLDPFLMPVGGAARHLVRGTPAFEVQAEHLSVVADCSYQRRVE
jgi:hypothetical protein